MLGHGERGLGECSAVTKRSLKARLSNRSSMLGGIRCYSEKYILASTISSSSIIRLAVAMDWFARFIDLHFTNPVPVLHYSRIISHNYN